MGGPLRRDETEGSLIVSDDEQKLRRERIVLARNCRGLTPSTRQIEPAGSTTFTVAPVASLPGKNEVQGDLGELVRRPSDIRQLVRRPLEGPE